MLPCRADYIIFPKEVSRVVSTDSLLSQVASVLSLKDVHRYSEIFIVILLRRATISLIGTRRSDHACRIGHARFPVSYNQLIVFVKSIRSHLRTFLHVAMQTRLYLHAAHSGVSGVLVVGVKPRLFRDFILNHKRSRSAGHCEYEPRRINSSAVSA